MSIPPKRTKLTATPAMQAAATKSAIPLTAIRAKPLSKLEQNTRLGHVFWCGFSPHNWPPEFDDKHLVVVIRGGARANGTHVVVPLTSQPQTGEFAYKLKYNPNPRSAPEAWAVCDHIYTVASERLEQLRDDKGHFRRSLAIDADDLREIGRKVFASLNSLRRHTFGVVPERP